MIHTNLVVILSFASSTSIPNKEFKNVDFPDETIPTIGIAFLHSIISVFII